MRNPAPSQVPKSPIQTPREDQPLLTSSILRTHQPVRYIAAVTIRGTEAIAQIGHVDTPAVVLPDPLPDAALLLARRVVQSVAAAGSKNAQDPIADHLLDAPCRVGRVVGNSIVALHQPGIANGEARGSNLCVATRLLHDHGQDDARVNWAVRQTVRLVGDFLDGGLDGGDVSVVVYYMQRGKIESPERREGLPSRGLRKVRGGTGIDC